jgi:hypothetical protein
MYIFKKGNDYVSLDSMSGGYPYITPNMFSAHTWKTIKDAIEYESHFKSQGWKLYKVLGLNLEEVESSLIDKRNRLLEELQEIEDELNV